MCASRWTTVVHYSTISLSQYQGLIRWRPMVRWIMAAICYTFLPQRFFSPSTCQGFCLLLWRQSGVSCNCDTLFISVLWAVRLGGQRPPFLPYPTCHSGRQDRMRLEVSEVSVICSWWRVTFVLDPGLSCQVAEVRAPYDRVPIHPRPPSLLVDFRQVWLSGYKVCSTSHCTICQNTVVLFLPVTSTDSIT